MKTKVLFLLFLLSMQGIQMQAQVDIVPIEEFSSGTINNMIPTFQYDKFWEVLDRNYISYTSSDNWIVESDTSCYIFDNDENPMDKEHGFLWGQLSPINRRLGGLQLGRLLYRDGKCFLAINTCPKRVDGNKLTIPLREEALKDYIFTRVGNHFGFSQPGRSMSRQALKDVEMLVTYYPTEIAKDIFNGVSMFVYPLNFQGKAYRGTFSCGRGVVIISKNNIPLELYFFMTDESVKDFDNYLSSLKGVFIFQDVCE
ncbi:MAG: hypothetical protein IJS43_04995 [Bacteroidaceae bacterium]|nr:hypothetical protein [Bacteroidaceae bacterium]